ncbi:DUF1990 family protein [Streptomyces sp. NPDC048507]|uniref:DUF1990 family protein n=1 Tax=Streptomyces sp. NPDC048507 TaxID=3365560 RepID=UPI0037195836
MTRLTGARQETLNYPDRGATSGRPLPAGYNHLRHRARIGRGRPAFEAAGAAVTTFVAHRASGMRVRTAAADQAAAVRPGLRVEVGMGLGPLRITAPCEVIWTAYEPARTGFAYGTRTGHPARGEESFVVEIDDDGAVWFTVTAFSRPDRWYTRLAGPVLPLLQHAYARHLGRHVRALAARA